MDWTLEREAGEELDRLLDQNPDFAGPLHDAVRQDRIHGFRYVAIPGDPCVACIYGTLARMRGLVRDEWDGDAILMEFVNRVRALRIVAVDATPGLTPLEMAHKNLEPGGGGDSTEIRKWLDARIAAWKARNAK